MRSWLKAEILGEEKVCSPGSQSTAEQGKHSDVHLELIHRVQANKWYFLSISTRSLYHLQWTPLCLYMCVCVRERGENRELYIELTVLTELHPVPVKCERESQAQHSAPRLPQQKHNMLALKDHAGSHAHPPNNIISFIILYAAYWARVSTRTINRGGGWKSLHDESPCVLTLSLRLYFSYHPII